MLVTEPVHPWPYYRAMPLAFINHGSQALGVARAAVTTAIETAQEERGWGGVALTEIGGIQTAIAEATALVESGRRFLYGAATELWEDAQSSEQPDPKLSARTRLATSHAATSSLEAVDIVHRALATSSIFESSPLERQFRDIHTAAAHVMIGPMTYEAAGRVELGLEAQFPFF
jgi:alkylation response protein AidB-like acyl-CoA dehydrogenase